MSIKNSLKIRKAKADDSARIVHLIKALAEYEREPEAAVVTEADILRDGFGENPKFRVLIAEWKGEPVGFAFYFFNYSTWEGRPGLYLEDLFVYPENRGLGIGRALMIELAKIATKNNCTRFAWQALDWNKPAISFYEKIGARLMTDWLTFRLESKPIQALAAEKW